MKETPLKKAVIAILQSTHGPLSVPELKSLLGEQGLSPHKTSLYRLLEKLEQTEIIEPVLLDSQVSHFELKRHHHHHFVCEECNTVTCVDDPNLEDSIHKLCDQLQQKGLAVLRHEFSLSGHCLQCQ